MATPYLKVYGVFFSKVSDFDIPNLDDDDRNAFLYDLMLSAVTRFSVVCKTDLSDRDNENEQFNGDLSDNEIDIITEIMVENWLKPKLYNSDLLRQNLGTKDFTVFSNANLVNSLRETYNNAHSRCESMMNKYSFNVNDVRKLGKGDEN